MKEHKHLSNRFFKILKFFIIFFYVVKEFIRKRRNINELSRLNPGLFNSGKGIPSKYYNQKYFESKNSSKYFPKMIKVSEYAKKSISATKIAFKDFGSKIIVLKPDKGARSIGVFVTTSDSERYKILSKAKNTQYVAQEFVPYKNELGIFYCKIPGSSKGKIIGIAEKKFQNVTGDGKRNLIRLLRTKLINKAIRTQLKHKYGSLRYIPKEGEVVTLVNIVDHDDGAEYYDRPDLITKKMQNAFDQITSGKEVYFCRFDIRARSIEDFKNGDFKILEVNPGFTAVLLHAVDPRYNLRKQIARYKKDFKNAFTIASKLRGRPTLSFLEFCFHFFVDELKLVLLRFRLRNINKN